jgi:predicted NAD/FAD-dependent oxidoreductase
MGLLLLSRLIAKNVAKVLPTQPVWSQMHVLGDQNEHRWTWDMIGGSRALWLACQRSKHAHVPNPSFTRTLELSKTTFSTAGVAFEGLAQFRLATPI